MAARPGINDTLVDQQLDRVLEDSLISEPSPEVRARIEAAILDSLEPVSPLPSTGARAAEFLSIFVGIAVLKIALLGVGAFRQMSTYELIGSTIATVIGATWLSLSLARQTTPGSLRRFSPATVIGVLTATFLIGGVLLIPWHATEVFRVEGWPCFTAGVLIAPLFGALYWLPARRGTPLASITFGATLGAIGGLLAAAVPTISQLSCSHREVVGHLWVWHGGVVLLWTMLGASIAAVFSRFEVGRA